MNYLYARTSTDHQENGMEDQQLKLRAWADQRGGSSEMHTEEASGKSLAKRPVLVEVLGELDANGGTLVVTTLTRLSRSTVDFFNMVRRADREGWSIAVLDMDLDTSTATGKLIAGILVQVGEWEAEVLSERVKDGLARARANGVRLGRPSKVPEETRRLIDMLRRQGMTWQAIAEKLNEDGVPTPSGRGNWYKMSVRRHRAEASDG